MPGRIPQSFINDLLDRTDIAEVIGGYVALKRKGTHLWANCPFHQEKTASFAVNPERSIFKCFGCGASGTVLTFLMDHQHLQFVEAVELLASRLGLSVPREGGAATAAQLQQAQRREQLLVALNQAHAQYVQWLQGDSGASARDYLEGRGINAHSIESFALGFVPERWDGVQRMLHDDGLGEEAGLIVRNENGRTYDRFRNRLMFPIRDARGRVIGFGGRVLDGSEPKYLNSPETAVFHKGQQVYGLYECRKANRQLKRIIIVEGYLDVVSLHQIGVQEAVATLGTATTLEQLSLLFRLVPEIVCCFDGDTAGRKAAARVLDIALPLITDERRLSFVFLPEGEDPDSLARKGGRAAWDRATAQPKSFVDYLFEHYAEGLDLRLLEHRANLAKRVEPVLARLPNGVLRGLVRDRLRRQVWGGRPQTLTSAFAAGVGAGPLRPTPVSLERRALIKIAHDPQALQDVPDDLLTRWIEALAPSPVDTTVTVGANKEREVLCELLVECRRGGALDSAALLGGLPERSREYVIAALAAPFDDQDIALPQLMGDVIERGRRRLHKASLRQRREPLDEDQLRTLHEERLRREEMDIALSGEPPEAGR